MLLLLVAFFSFSLLRTTVESARMLTISDAVILDFLTLPIHFFLVTGEGSSANFRVWGLVCCFQFVLSGLVRISSY